MNMGIAMTFGVGGMVLLLHSLPADFRIDGTPPPAAVIQGPASPAPPKGPPLAVGFGQKVPLEFAVRQIAPRWLHVSYGDTVNSHMRVSWHGGRPWNQVLGGVLKPLGLHMKMSGRTLWISG
jgi:hypothetical protein